MVYLLIFVLVTALSVFPLRWAALYCEADNPSYPRCVAVSVAASVLNILSLLLTGGSLAGYVIFIVLCVVVMAVPGIYIIRFAVILALINAVILLIAVSAAKSLFGLSIL